MSVAGAIALGAVLVGAYLLLSSLLGWIVHRLLPDQDEE